MFNPWLALSLKTFQMGVVSIWSYDGCNWPVAINFYGSCALFQRNTTSRVANFPRGWSNSKEKSR